MFWQRNTPTNATAERHLYCNITGTEGYCVGATLHSLLNDKISHYTCFHGYRFWIQVHMYYHKILLLTLWKKIIRQTKKKTWRPLPDRIRRSCDRGDGWWLGGGAAMQPKPTTPTQMNGKTGVIAAPLACVWIRLDNSHTDSLWQWRSCWRRSEMFLFGHSSVSNFSSSTVESARRRSFNIRS